MGAEEYGPINFLKVDLPEFIVEELADLANYARFLYIRIRLLQGVALEGGIDLSAGAVEQVQSEDELSSGPSTFIPEHEISQFLHQGKDKR